MQVDTLDWYKLNSLSSLHFIIFLTGICLIVDSAKPVNPSSSRQMCMKIQSMLSLGKHHTYQISSNLTYVPRNYAQNFLAYSPIDDLLIFLEPKYQLHVYSAQAVHLIGRIPTANIVYASSCISITTGDRYDLCFIYESRIKPNVISIRVCEVRFNTTKLQFEDKKCIDSTIRSDRTNIRINGFTIKRDHFGTKRSLLFVSTNFGLVYTIFDLRTGITIRKPIVLNDTLTEGSVVLTSAGVVYYANKEEHTIHEIHVTRDFRIRYGKIIKSNAIKSPFGLITDECNHLFISTKTMVLVMYMQTYTTIRSIFSRPSEYPITIERINSSTYIYPTVKKLPGKAPAKWLFNIFSFADPTVLTTTTPRSATRMNRTLFWKMIRANRSTKPTYNMSMFVTTAITHLTVETTYTSPTIQEESMQTDDTLPYSSTEQLSTIAADEIHNDTVDESTSFDTARSSDDVYSSTPPLFDQDYVSENDDTTTGYSEPVVDDHSVSLNPKDKIDVAVDKDSHSQNNSTPALQSTQDTYTSTESISIMYEISSDETTLPADGTSQFVTSTAIEVTSLTDQFETTAATSQSSAQTFTSDLILQNDTDMTSTSPTKSLLTETVFSDFVTIMTVTDSLASSIKSTQREDTDSTSTLPLFSQKIDSLLTKTILTTFSTHQDSYLDSHKISHDNSLSLPIENSNTAALHSSSLSRMSSTTYTPSHHVSAPTSSHSLLTLSSTYLNSYLSSEQFSELDTTELILSTTQVTSTSTLHTTTPSVTSIITEHSSRTTFSERLSSTVTTSSLFDTSIVSTLVTTSNLITLSTSNHIPETSLASTTVTEPRTTDYETTLTSLITTTVTSLDPTTIIQTTEEPSTPLPTTSIATTDETTSLTTDSPTSDTTFISSTYPTTITSTYTEGYTSSMASTETVLETSTLFSTLPTDEPTETSTEITTELTTGDFLLSTSSATDAYMEDHNTSTQLYTDEVSTTSSDSDTTETATPDLISETTEMSTTELVSDSTETESSTLLDTNFSSESETSITTSYLTSQSDITSPSVQTTREDATTMETSTDSFTTTTETELITSSLPTWYSTRKPVPEQQTTTYKSAVHSNLSNTLLSNELFDTLLTNSSSDQVISFDLSNLPTSSWNLSLQTNKSIVLDIALPDASTANGTTNLSMTNIVAERFTTNIVGSPVSLQVDQVQTKQFSLAMNLTSNLTNQMSSDVVIGHVKSEQFQLDITKSDNMNIHVKQVDSETAELFFDSKFCTNDTNLQINLNLTKNGTIRYGNRSPIRIGPVFTRVHMLKQSCDLEQPFTVFFDICQGQNPCLNGGTCQSQTPNYDDPSYIPKESEISYTCLCPMYIFGEQCEQSQYPMGYCINNGTLTYIVDSSNRSIESCICASGFHGEHCEENIDDCVNVRCSNHGICHDETDSYTCSCFDGYYGSECEQKNVETVLLQVATKSFATVAILLIAGIASLVVASDIHTYFTRKKHVTRRKMYQCPRAESELYENSVLLLGFGDAPVELNEIRSSRGRRRKRRPLPPPPSTSKGKKKRQTGRQRTRTKKYKSPPQKISSRTRTVTNPAYETIL
ncbi:unnamed protein product [Adineta ricciae]|uniref:EGF-like domain-containing protein n=1 Tax=Adineta ricciae TaxID=249248 RepID=A0A813WLN6_ADIRI|nr:unnamed protein product [Adineta ricciae]CAF1069145.1 unnamed protein product [Adineta ricciae]